MAAISECIAAVSRGVNPKVAVDVLFEGVGLAVGNTALAAGIGALGGAGLGHLVGKNAVNHPSLSHLSPEERKALVRHYRKSGRNIGGATFGALSVPGSRTALSF